MRFWEWLTSVNGLPVLVALIGVIGTVVAVAATIITQAILRRVPGSKRGHVLTGNVSGLLRTLNGHTEP